MGAIFPSTFVSKAASDHNPLKSSSSSSSSSSSLLTTHDPEEFIELLFSFTQKVAAQGGMIDEGLKGGQSGFAGAVITHESMSYALGVTPLKRSIPSSSSTSERIMLKRLLIEDVCSRVCRALAPSFNALSRIAAADPTWQAVSVVLWCQAHNFLRACSSPTPRWPAAASLPLLALQA
jgi:hypothetical protein